MPVTQQQQVTDDDTRRGSYGDQFSNREASFDSLADCPDDKAYDHHIRTFSVVSSSSSGTLIQQTSGCLASDGGSPCNQPPARFTKPLQASPVLSTYSAACVALPKPSMSLIPRGVKRDEVNVIAAFAALEADCRHVSLRPFEDTRRLLEAALSVFADDSGLKRFYPLALTLPTLEPDSAPPCTEIPSNYHSARLCRATSFDLVQCLFARSGLSATVDRKSTSNLAAAVVVLLRRVCMVRPVTLHMLHRATVGAVVVTIKSLGPDAKLDLAAISAASHIEVWELVRLEAQVLADLDWNAYVSAEHIRLVLTAA